MQTKPQVAEQLTAAARGSDPITREQFQKLVSLTCETFGLIDVDLADITGASRATTQRWRVGIGAPANASRKSMLDLLAKYARARAKPANSNAERELTPAAPRVAAPAR